jgi:hypothetical protein
LLLDLLETKQIDAALVASPQAARPWFKKDIVKTPDQIVKSCGSVYHMINDAEVIRCILEGPEQRYAIVALPCVVKALRLAQSKIPKLKRCIVYIIGLVCGGVRTRCFADVLAGLAGTNQGFMSYRSKHNALQANDFSFQMQTPMATRRVKFRGLFGYLYLNGIGAQKSCHFCSDVFAELADVTFMDAWLDEYIKDPRGCSLAISRNAFLSEILIQMLAKQVCQGGRIPAESVEKSQAAVVAKKRSLLAARYTCQRQMGWAPKHDPVPVGMIEYAEAETQLEISTLLRTRLARHARRIGKRGLASRICAWLICVEMYRLLRARKRNVIKKEAILFYEPGAFRQWLKDKARKALALTRRKETGHLKMSETNSSTSALLRRHL